jgi:hypothetical protein
MVAGPATISRERIAFHGLVSNFWPVTTESLNFFRDLIGLPRLLICGLKV